METDRDKAWRGFKPGPWCSRMNVRAFIQRNYTPYVGDRSFLAGATARTSKVREKLVPLLAEEREKGVPAVSQEPSSILAHTPGYIDQDLEVIVGLQIDAPLQALFETEAIPLWVWPWLLPGEVVFFLVVEAEKLIIRTLRASRGSFATVAWAPA